jgi:hypothetical protein
MRPLAFRLVRSQRAYAEKGGYYMDEPVIGTITIRRFIEGKLVLKENLEVTDPADLRQLGERHVLDLQDETRPWLIEIEMLNDPSEERFIRFGTDQAGMIDPLPFPEPG